MLRRAPSVDVFAEIEPKQKERIIIALKKAGHVVGYMGDGINDAPALHAADVGLSVESAVDVAREAADFVLLERDLEVLVDGVREGRRTFANTLKYVFIATSANFGNMFSMAGASLFLPFLPLLPKQILLINLLTDFPEMTIASDNVDDELVQAPRRWDIGFIRRFMIVFGLISSVFDYLTFGVLLWLNATVAQFRTGWFIESIVSASLDRARRAQPPAIFQKPTEQNASACDCGNRPDNGANAAAAICWSAWFSAHCPRISIRSLHSSLSRTSQRQNLPSVYFIAQIARHSARKRNNRSAFRTTTTVLPLANDAQSEIDFFSKRGNHE